MTIATPVAATGRAVSAGHGAHAGSACIVSCVAPATCGELVQGCIDGRDFLVNCPVDLYSFATARPCDAPGLHLEHAGQFGKVAEAVRLLGAMRRLDLHHELRVQSDIPRCKGMASSTADITAALDAVCRSCGVQLSDREFAELLTAVEPSDCVHFPGIAEVNHLTGALVDRLPAPHGLRVLVVDCGGEVDTVGFDREHARAVYRRHQPAIRAALSLLKLGLRNRDHAAIGLACTLSGQISQEILRKPQFDDLLACAREAGAYGLNCAHSGTVLGVLYREVQGGPDASIAERVRDRLGDGVAIQGDHRIVAGGRRAAH